MDINENYVADSRGRRRSVQLSLADWKKVQQELERARIREELREAFTEIREIEVGRPSVTLQEFLQQWDDEQRVASGQ